MNVETLHCNVSTNDSPSQLALIAPTYLEFWVTEEVNLFMKGIKIFFKWTRSARKNTSL
jgi:hypothetical protein